MENKKTINNGEIFVSPLAQEHGNGSREYPFSSIEEALSLVGAGSSVVLLNGTYSETVSIQISGELTNPIKIRAEKLGGAVVTSNWFLYDSSDIIISGIIFRDIPSQAISVIGNCERNSFYELTFLNCGTSEKKPCTIFFGGSGAYCIVVEKCLFDNRSSKKSKNSIAIIVTEGDTEEQNRANKNFLIRENRFLNYGTTISLGTRDESVSNENYSHIIESNRIEKCFEPAIKVRCNGSIIRDNLIKNCQKSAVDIICGSEQEISSNRIENCVNSIELQKSDVTISQNCFIKNIKSDICIIEKIDNRQGAISIINNTFVSNNNGSVSIVTPKKVPIVVTENIFSYSKDIFHKSKKIATTHFVNNIMDPKILFEDISVGNYSTDKNEGAVGWAVLGEDIPIVKKELVELSLPLKNGDKVESLIKEVDGRELYSRSFFINQEDNMESDEEIEDIDNAEMTDYSTWD